MVRRNEALMFIIPFAGGSAHSMVPFAQEINKFCVVEILELPGRGKRINEPLLTNTDEIINDLWSKVIPKIGPQYKDYFIFGHSMGTILGILLIQKIVRERGIKVSHFFVSGRGGPSKEYDLEDRNTHLLPSKEFKEKLRELGGSPDEVLDNDDLMEFFEPIIRADFQAIATFHYKKSGKLDVPITGFFGSDEKTKLEDMQLWQLESIHPVEIVQFPGHHFFVFNCLNEIIKIMKDRVEERMKLNNISLG